MIAFMILFAVLGGCPDFGDYNNGVFYVALHHELSFAAPSRGCPSEVPWPEELEPLAAIIVEFGGSAYTNARNRSITVTFEAGDRPSDWYEDVVVRAESIPGVLSAACLPAVEIKPDRGFVSDDVPPEPFEKWASPDCDCPNGTVLLDVVIARDGKLLDPLVDVAKVDAECAECLRQWAGTLAWKPARRPNGPYPVSIVIPVRFE